MKFKFLHTNYYSLLLVFSFDPLIENKQLWLQRVHGESTSMVWPTLGSRTAKDQIRFRLKPASGMVSILDLIIPSLLRERFLFTCSPMTIIMSPFWFVAVLDVILRIPTTIFCAPCGLRGVMRPWFDFWFRRYIYIYIVCLFISYASPLIFSSHFPYLSPPLLIFSFENRPAPFPGRMS